MKFAMVTDTHLGIYANSETFLNNSKSFFEWMRDDLLKTDIRTIVFGGDMFHNMETTNILTFNVGIHVLEEVLKDFKIYLIVGNHDSYYKTTIDVNSLVAFKHFPNVELISSPKVITMGTHTVAMVPWQVNDTLLVDDSFQADVCIGHFELKGFNFNKKTISQSGWNVSWFLDRFKHTYSGHFHTCSEYTNGSSWLRFIGTPYQQDWHDTGEERGYSVHDLDTGEYSFHPNINCIKFEFLEYPEPPTSEKVTNNVVDLIVRVDDSFDEIDFAKYIEKIVALSPVKLSKSITKITEAIAETTYMSEKMNIVDMLFKRIEDSQIDLKSDVNSYMHRKFKEQALVS